MDTFERVELRRFVGRELLLFLWFESEILEATLETREHGSFGLWLEGRLVLSAGKETTAIKGSLPGAHREAKEALLRGKLPDVATLHLSWGGKDAAFSLRGDTLAIGGLKLPRPAAEEETAAAITAPAPAPRRASKKARRSDDPARARAAAAEADAILADEDFFERMRVTSEIEAIVEALYRAFLTLRLGPAWEDTVVPAMTSWIAGEADAIDVSAYSRARAKALAGTRKRTR